MHISKPAVSLRVILVLALIVLAGSLGCESAKPRPARLSIHITGNIRGHIKNCGCSSGQYGGFLRMARKAEQEMQNAVKTKGSDGDRSALTMLIDVGNFLSPDTQISRLTSKGVVMGMGEIDYSAIGLGKYELSFSQEDLWAMLGEANLPLTAANLHFTTAPTGTDHSDDLNALIQPYRIVEVEGSFSVGVIHVIDDNAQQVIGELNGFELRKAESAAKDVLDNHVDEADFWVLTIADTQSKGTGPQAIAELTDLDIVVGFKGNNPLEAVDSTAVLFPYFIDPPYLKAKDVMQVEVNFPAGDTDPMIIARRLAIPETIKPHEKVSAIVDQIDEQLEILENEAAAEWLKQDAVHPEYVGHDSCRSCHGKIVAQHMSTHHANALSSLVDVGQNSSAACLYCHVVGHPNLPGVTSTGGWNKLDDPPVLRGVQCESCHGPGEYHVPAMLAQISGGQPPEDIKDVVSTDGRNLYGLIDVDEATCLLCHDSENSPNFDYQKYWLMIRH